jgi:hypothetical protein
MKIVENKWNKKWVPHSCRFPYEIYQPIHRLSQKNQISFNQMVCEILKTHPRLGLV